MLRVVAKLVGFRRRLGVRKLAYRRAGVYLARRPCRLPEHSSNKNKLIIGGLLMFVGVICTMVIVSGNVSAEEMAVVNMVPTFEGTPTQRGWSTPTAYLSPTPRTMYPCTVVPPTPRFNFTFPTIIFPTIQPTNTLILTATNTGTPTSTATLVPTVSGFYMEGNPYVSMTGSCVGVADNHISCNLEQGGQRWVCTGSVNCDGKTGAGEGIVGVSFHHSTWSYIYAYTSSVWESPYWGYNKVRYNDAGGAAHTVLDSGGGTWSGSAIVSQSQARTDIYFLIGTDNGKLNHADFIWWIQEIPFPSNTATATATATRTPTQTLTPTGTVWPCQELPSIGNTPIAEMPNITFEYGSCTTILPGFTIPLLGAWGLDDLVVPNVSVCVMWTTIQAVFMGITIDTVLIPLIVLGLAFALFNEFRS